MKFQSTRSTKSNIVTMHILWQILLHTTNSGDVTLNTTHNDAAKYATNSVDTDSLTQFCTTDGSRMICDGQLPKHIPSKITDVVVMRYTSHNITTPMFNHSSWQQVKTLHINRNLIFSPTYDFEIEINKNAFDSLQHLRVFGLHNEGYITITTTSFLGLDNLKELDLNGCARLASEDLTRALTGNNILPNLRRIRLERANTANSHMFYFNDGFAQMLYQKSITYLDLSSTNMYINLGSEYRHMFSLQYLNISNTTLTVKRPSMTVHEMESLFPNLTTLDVSLIPARYLALSDNTAIHGWNYRTCIPALQWENVYINYIFKKSFQITDGFLDLSRCPPSALRHLEFVGNHAVKLNATLILPKMLHPVTLNVSLNNLQYLSPKSFEALQSLETFDISHNSIGAMERLPEFADLLISFSNLLHIYLSHNKLNFIPREMFHNNTQLTVIDLSDNNLESIQFSVGHLSKLKKLFLQRNAIKLLDVDTMVELKYLFSIQEADTDNGSSLQIYFEGNKLQCSCETREFIQFLVSTVQPGTKSRYRCIMEGDVILTNEDAVSGSSYLCIRDRVIAISVVVSVIAVIAIVTASSVTWWKIKSWKRKKQLAMFLEDYRYGYVEESYLAYIIYHVNVEEWLVHEEIYQPLLKELQEKIRTTNTVICSNNNIPHNHSVYQVSTELISKSRVIIYVLSDDSCSYHDGLHNTILEEAISTSKPILQININEVDKDKLPKELNAVLKRSKEVAKLVVGESSLEIVPGWTVFSDSVLKWASHSYTCTSRNSNNMMQFNEL